MPLNNLVIIVLQVYGAIFLVLAALILFFYLVDRYQQEQLRKIRRQQHYISLAIQDERRQARLQQERDNQIFEEVIRFNETPW